MPKKTPENLDVQFIVAQERAERFMHDVILPARAELVPQVIDLDQRIAEIVG
jgi:hypothetical protein